MRRRRARPRGSDTPAAALGSRHAQPDVVREEPSTAPQQPGQCALLIHTHTRLIHVDPQPLLPLGRVCMQQVIPLPGRSHVPKPAGRRRKIRPGLFRPKKMRPFFGPPPLLFLYTRPQFCGHFLAAFFWRPSPRGFRFFGRPFRGHARKEVHEFGTTHTFRRVTSSGSSSRTRCAPA